MLSSLDYVASGLRALRKERGISQAALAEAAQVSTKLVSAIEQRDRTPSLATLDKLCGALNVSPLELLEAGSPASASFGRGVSERAASMFRGLSEDQSERLLEVVRRMRELMVDRPSPSRKKRRPSRGYGAPP